MTVDARALAAQIAFDPHGLTADAVDGLSFDQAWPRTGGWSTLTSDSHVDMVLVGVPTSTNSLSPSHAEQTPAAVRTALRRYSSHTAEPGTRAARGTEAELVLDETLRIADAGDLPDPDSREGEQAAAAAIAQYASQSELVVALGGDNSLTVPVALGAAEGDLAKAGLITFDAHHDLRDGRSNGSPVRRLIEAGLDPRRIVQVGIADFANSRAYRQRAKDLGITVIHRDELHERPMSDVVAEALEVAGVGGGPIHVDLDVDVCDRSVAPACPASLPGGLAAWELRAATKLLARDPRVHSIDFAEVDATVDAPDGRTVRLVALCVLEAAAGLAAR